MAVVVQNSSGAIAFLLGRGRRNVRAVLTTDGGYRGVKEFPIAEFDKQWYALEPDGFPYPADKAAQLWLDSPLVLTVTARKELEMIVISNDKGEQVAAFADDQEALANQSIPPGFSSKKVADRKEVEKMAKKQTEAAAGATEKAKVETPKAAKVEDTRKYKALPLAEGAKVQKDSERSKVWQYLTDNGPQVMATLAEKLEGMTVAKVKAAIGFLVATKKVEAVEEKAGK